MAAVADDRPPHLMAGKPGFFRFVSAAFNARPFGMFVPPNWIALAATGLLGLAEPGFWAIGAGLELGYLLLLANNERFQPGRNTEQMSRGSLAFFLKNNLAKIAGVNRQMRCVKFPNKAFEPARCVSLTDKINLRPVAG